MATDPTLVRHRPTLLNRRALLAGVAASCVPFVASGSGAARYLASCRMPDGQMAAAILDGRGEILRAEPIAARGHGAAVAPDRTAGVLFARRPGRFAVVFDLVRQRRSLAFAPPPDRRFAGHGAFSRDGRLLFAAENDFEAERGVIGIYAAADSYRRLGEFDTGGIGPHEVLLVAGGAALAVANGGIATHPDFPRAKLNLATMAPSLVLLDALNGELRAKAELPPALNRLSIRHLAETRPGELWFGAQYEGPKADTVPLVGTFDEARGLTLADADPSVMRALDHYVGSVAASRDGRTVVTTSPRGGVALEWDAGARILRKMHRLRDVCGAAPAGRAGILLTAGTGRVQHTDGVSAQAAVAWDNHVYPV